MLLSENIKHIGEEAFYGNYRMKRIQAPGVETIGEKAFAHCETLEEMNFEQNLKVIPEKAFIKCSNLKDFTLSEELMEIGYGSLYECSVLDSIRISSEKVSYFGQRAFKKGMTFYIPLITSEEYMKELKDYAFAFYDLDGDLLESIYEGIDALLIEYPQYNVGDSYEVIRDAIGVYIEYSDNTMEEVKDFFIEEGIFVEGGQEITISYAGLTDTIKVGSSPNKQPVYYISPRNPTYDAVYYKIGDSFQKVKEKNILYAFYEDGSSEVLEEYDVWPGIFKEGDNKVIFSFCDFVGGKYKTQMLYCTATEDGDEDSNVPSGPNVPEEKSEGVITGMEVEIRPGGGLENPKAGSMVKEEDLFIYYNVETSEGTEKLEANASNSDIFIIYQGRLERGDNKVQIRTVHKNIEENKFTQYDKEIIIHAEAKLESLEVKLKDSVKLKPGDKVKPSHFTATATYSGENWYTDTQEVQDIVIEGNDVITEGTNVIQVSYTETTSAYGTITKTAEWKMCTDDKPVLSADALTINPYEKETVSFEVYMPFGLNVKLDGVFYQNKTGSTQNDIIYTVSENGICTVQIPETISNKTYSLFVKAKVQETAKIYYLPIKITVKAVLPKITATAEKMNIFYTDERSRTSFITLKNPSGEEIQKVTFEENSMMDKYFDVIFDKEKQTLALKLTKSDAVKKNIVSKGKICVWMEKYNKPVMVNVTVSVSEKQPKLKITPSSVNINTWMYDDKETIFEVFMQEGKNYISVTLDNTTPKITAGVEFFRQIRAENNKVILNLKNTADFKKVKTVKVNLQAANWKKPITVSYKIKIVHALPKAVLEKKSLTLDMRAIGVEESTVLRFDAKPGTVSYNDLPEVLTAVKKSESAPKVTLEKVDARTYVVKAAYMESMKAGTYKYEIFPELSDGTELKKVTLSVKVTTAKKAANASLKVQKGSKIELINRENTKFEYMVSPTVKGTYIKDIRLIKVELGKENADISLFKVKVNKENDVVTSVEIAASKDGNITAGKKYKFTFEVIPATPAKELEHAETTVAITPKESKLQLSANVKTAVLYRNISAIGVKYQLTPKMAGAEIDTMEYVPSVKVPEGAFEITQTENETYQIRIADKTKVEAKKSYKLSFKVRAKGGTKTVTQNLTIKIQ